MVFGLRCSDFEPTLYVLLILFTDREMGAKKFFCWGGRNFFCWCEEFFFVGAKNFFCWGEEIFLLGRRNFLVRANEILAKIMIRETWQKNYSPQADLCPVSRYFG